MSAVLKRGDRSKFCHLHISDEFQNMHLGELFFALMALEVRNIADEIHFTLPDSLWNSKQDFFRSFGFQEVVKAGKQYRLFDEELHCAASFQTVWNSVLEKLPKMMTRFSSHGYSMNPAILLSVKAKHVERILSGVKTVEIRRRFSTKWTGQCVSLYASHPVQGLVGEAIIKDVVYNSQEEIWSRFETEIGCTREEFDKCVGTSKCVYAVVLSGIHPYLGEMPLTQLSALLNQGDWPPPDHLARGPNG